MNSLSWNGWTEADLLVSLPHPVPSRPVRDKFASRTRLDAQLANMVSAIGRGIMAVFSGIASILNAIVSVRRPFRALASLWELPLTFGHDLGRLSSAS